MKTTTRLVATASVALGQFAEFTSILADLDDGVAKDISDFEPWVPDGWVVSVATWLSTADRDWPPADVPADWPPACVVLPSDPDAVVLDIEDGSIVVLADGRVFRSLAIDDDLALVPWFGGRSMPEAAPPPRSPSGYEVATLTADGWQRLVSLANDAGLFVDDPDYGDGPTDQGYFDIVVNASDGTFEHHVYAPSFPTGDPATQERRDHLFGFVDTLRRIDEEFGDGISAFENFVPECWIVTVGNSYVAGPDTWPDADPPVAGCSVLASDDGIDSVSGVYRYDDGTGLLTVVVEPVIVGSMCGG